MANKKNSTKTPECLKDIERFQGSFEAFLEEILKIRGIGKEKMQPIPITINAIPTVVHGNVISSVQTYGFHKPVIELCYKARWRHMYTFALVYFDDLGNQWNNELYIEIPYEYFGYRSRNAGQYARANVSDARTEKWTLSNELIDGQYILINTPDDLEEKAYKINPYGSFYIQNNYPGTGLEVILMAPYLEQLDKAGYEFAREIIHEAAHKVVSHKTELMRLVKPGKNLKEIFKCDKAVYDALKDCKDLKQWDSFRKMYKKGRIKDVRKVYESGYSATDIDKIDQVLRKQWNGRPVFSWSSLMKYLDRVDHFEAIPFFESIQLLNDYLQMCNMLNMKPVLDGDSLKREHDVTARTVRQKRDEIMAQKMEHACIYNKRYDYMDENIFFGRAIRSYDDLLNEATQQHNCVGGYANSIANKKSIICVVRTKANPEKSLATVEFDPQNGTVRQKYLACNRPIRNAALTDFINRYQKVVQSEIRAAKTA